MIFNIRQLGRIENATIDLSKDLTVFCGPNNTGKTFLSYALYGLSIPSWRRPEISTDLRERLKDLFKTGYTEVNLYELFQKNREAIYRQINESLRSKLPDLLGADREGLRDTTVSLSFDEGDIEADIRSLPFMLRGFSLGEGASVEFSKEPNSVILKLTKSAQNKLDIGLPYTELNLDQLQDAIFQFSLSPLGVFNFFLAAERIGITVFGKELLSNRFTFTSELQALDETNRKAIFDFLSRRTSRYPKPVQDLIQESQQPYRLTNPAAEHLANDLEENVLRGKISTDSAGNIFYSFSDKTISIQQAASTIKSLSSLVLYLRNKAIPGNTIFFDEPEVNLHPDNQRNIARLIVKIVNLGIRVFVSTHSDYIIREFNNLLLLHKHRNNPTAKELMERYGYQDNEIIDSGKFAVYTFDPKQDGKVIVNPLPLTDEGFNISSISKIISTQNVAAQDIYSSLVECEHES